MRAYTVAWGRDESTASGQRTVTITGPDELDVVLDQIAAQAAGAHLPQVVDLYQGTWERDEPPPDGGMQFMVGHPERSWLSWLGDDPALAVDPTLPPWPDVVECERGGQWDEIGASWLTITAPQAREAAREYVRTGARPRCVRWRRPASASGD